MGGVEDGLGEGETDGVTLCDGETDGVTLCVGERDGVTLCVGDKDGVTLGVLVSDDDGHCEGVTDAVREYEEPKDTVAVGVGGMQAVNTTLPL